MNYDRIIIRSVRSYGMVDSNNYSSKGNKNKNIMMVMNKNNSKSRNDNG